MGSDIKQSLATAEKLLKQGKVDDAVRLCDEVIDDSRGDLLTVNRVGDILAATGYGERAVVYYSRIADQFARQGYYPKAIAIRKKILRLAPDDPRSMVALADVYVAQEHPGEARSFYLRAADTLIQAKDFDAAKEVYSRLVSAEPDDPRHRVRLAETRAVSGDPSGAAEELVELGDRLLQSGKPEDAEKAFRRAEELAPALPAIVRGLIGCLTETGRDDEARALLEQEIAKEAPAPELVGEMIQLCEMGGQAERVDQLLSGEHAAIIPESTLRELTQFHQRGDGLDGWWQRVSAAFESWRSHSLEDQRGLSWVEKFADWTEPSYLPALEARLQLGADADSPNERARLLERLIGGYRLAGRDDEAEPLLEELCELRPDSPLVEQATSPEMAVAAPANESLVTAAADVTAERADVPVEYEAPAVPLSRADEEFVAGRLTQAEILEKYGLISQSIDQLYEVVERFPGHLEANQRLVNLTRSEGQNTTLGPALVRLALARRAAGRVDIAQQSAQEAERLGSVDVAMKPVLIALGLLEGGGVVTPAAAPTEQVAPPAPVEELASQAPVVDTPAVPTSTAAESMDEAAAPPVTTQPAVEGIASGRDSVIDFDFEDDSADDSIDDNANDERGRDELPVPAVEEVAAAPKSPPSDASDVMTFAPLPSLSGDQEDDDLSAIAAALDEELFADELTPVSATPESESEESLDEVFAAFRERVEEQISGDDYRTHYDLGIGYKEMGLVDAAIAEFEVSAKAEDLYEESCVMLALCHRELSAFQDAANWYRQALDSERAHPEHAAGLRYDLAELLLESGDTKSALDLFRDLMQGDPEFRDVSTRVNELTANVTD